MVTTDLSMNSLPTVTVRTISVMQKKYTAQLTTTNVIRAVGLECIHNDIALTDVRRVVISRDGVVTEPDGHINLGLLDGFQLRATGVSNAV
jgi:hypothetical protein